MLILATLGWEYLGTVVTLIRVLSQVYSHMVAKVRFLSEALSAAFIFAVVRIYASLKSLFLHEF